MRTSKNYHRMKIAEVSTTNGENWSIVDGKRLLGASIVDGNNY